MAGLSPRLFGHHMQHPPVTGECELVVRQVHRDEHGSVQRVTGGWYLSGLR